MYNLIGYKLVTLKIGGKDMNPLAAASGVLASTAPIAIGVGLGILVAEAVGYGVGAIIKATSEQPKKAEAAGK